MPPKKGKSLYLTHCARCHGETGGPRKRIRAINSKKYLETVNDSILYKIIERGIPRTGMVSLGDKEGGPLNPEQINDLVAFIRSWEKTAPALPEEAPAKEKPLFTQEEAAYVGSESCIGCHESLHQKHIDAWKKSPMAQKAFSSHPERKGSRLNASPAMPRGTIRRRKRIKKRMWVVKRVMARVKNIRR